MSKKNESPLVRAMRKILADNFAYADEKSMRRYQAAFQACALIEDLAECPPDALPHTITYRLCKLTVATDEYVKTATKSGK